MKHLIQDQEEFNYFLWDILPELQRDEVYFVSLSARKKYLTEEERGLYDLGRTEMYARKVVRSKDKFKYVMNELSAIFNIRETKSGLPMPEKANVVYVNINPASMVKAVTAFKADMDREISQVINGLMDGGNPNYLALQYADRKLMNHIQKSKGTRHYLDVDVDSLDMNDLELLTRGLNDYQIKYHIIETHGGFHVLVDRVSLNQSKCPLHVYVKNLDNWLKQRDKECVFNQNGMIPVPGTLHAGKLVRVLE